MRALQELRGGGMPFLLVGLALAASIIHSVHAAQGGAKSPTGFFSFAATSVALLSLSLAVAYLLCKLQRDARAFDFLDMFAVLSCGWLVMTIVRNAIGLVRSL